MHFLYKEQTDPECSVCLTKWLQRPGMVMTLCKISIGLPGPSSLTDGIDRFKIMFIYLFLKYPYKHSFVIQIHHTFHWSFSSVVNTISNYGNSPVFRMYDSLNLKICVNIIFDSEEFQ